MMTRVSKYRRTRFIAAFFSYLCFYFMIPFAYAGDKISFVANKDVSVNSLTSTDIKNIFIGKKSEWDDGRRIIFAVLKNEDTHVAFLKKYIKKSPDQFKNYWRNMLFSGKGMLPPTFVTDAEVIDFVTKTSGAIGYVVQGSKGDVKVLTISD
ncbi:MAG: substrate-binding domain-containing protein [Proteobacteria bacterium]|nr:substrate-binding domain-containing protein [Pseudomonadota bacterium]